MWFIFVIKNQISPKKLLKINRVLFKIHINLKRELNNDLFLEPQTASAAVGIQTRVKLGRGPHKTCKQTRNIATKDVFLRQKTKIIKKN